MQTNGSERDLVPPYVREGTTEVSPSPSPLKHAPLGVVTASEGELVTPPGLGALCEEPLG